MMYNKDYNLSNKSSSKVPIEFEILIASFIISLIIIFFIAVPKYNEVKISKEHIRLIKKNTNLKKEALASLKGFKNGDENTSKSESVKVKSLLLEKNKSELYIANINEIAKSPNSKMEIISLDSVDDNKKNNSDKECSLKKTTINLVLLGEYDNLIAFLDRMEKIIPLINLEKLEVKKNNTINYDEVADSISPDDKVDFTVNITLSFYYM